MIVASGTLFSRLVLGGTHDYKFSGRPRPLDLSQRLSGLLTTALTGSFGRRNAFTSGSPGRSNAGRSLCSRAPSWASAFCRGHIIHPFFRRVRFAAGLVRSRLRFFESWSTGGRLAIWIRYCQRGSSDGNGGLTKKGLSKRVKVEASKAYSALRSISKLSMATWIATAKLN